MDGGNRWRREEIFVYMVVYKAVQFKGECQNFERKQKVKRKQRRKKNEKRKKDGGVCKCGKCGVWWKGGGERQWIGRTPVNLVVQGMTSRGEESENVVILLAYPSVRVSTTASNIVRTTPYPSVCSTFDIWNCM